MRSWADSGEGLCPLCDANRTTTFAYLPGSLLHTLTILNTITGTRVATWLYGSEKSGIASEITTFPGSSTTKIPPKRIRTSVPSRQALPGSWKPRILSPARHVRQPRGEAFRFTDPLGTVEE